MNLGTFAVPLEWGGGVLLEVILYIFKLYTPMYQTCYRCNVILSLSKVISNQSSSSLYHNASHQLPGLSFQG